MISEWSSWYAQQEKKKQQKKKTDNKDQGGCDTTSLCGAIINRTTNNNSDMHFRGSGLVAHNPGSSHEGGELNVQGGGWGEPVGGGSLAQHELPLLSHILEALLQQMHEGPHCSAHCHD